MSQANQVPKPEFRSASDPNGPEGVIVKDGTVIETGKTSYSVMALIGSGGFGQVYQVRDMSDYSKIYAMKVEKTSDNRPPSLKMEVHVLKLGPGQQRPKSHFATMEDRGKKEGYTFIVMQLVGQSLYELKVQLPNKVMTIPTGLSVGYQCLEACQDLHNIGFIHRDIKPGNFAIGLYDKRLIYMLDFGLARKIWNTDGVLKAPRVSNRCVGTPLYASTNSHMSLELGMRDDLESWFYLVMEQTNPNGLPWKGLRSMDKVLQQKCEAKMYPAQLLGPFAKYEDIYTIFTYIDKQTYCDRIDYEYIYKLLTKVLKSAGGSVADSYDWEEQKQ